MLFPHGNLPHAHHEINFSTGQCSAAWWLLDEKTTTQLPPTTKPLPCTHGDRLGRHRDDGNRLPKRAHCRDPPGCQASLTTGLGMSGFGLAPLATGNQGFGPTSTLGAKASGGPGQWANPTTGMEISSFGLAQPATGCVTTGHGDGLWLRPTGISKSAPQSGYCVGHSGNRSPGSMG